MTAGAMAEAECGSGAEVTSCCVAFKNRRTRRMLQVSVVQRQAVMLPDIATLGSAVNLWSEPRACVAWQSEASFTSPGHSENLHTTPSAALTAHQCPSIDTVIARRGCCVVTWQILYNAHFGTCQGRSILVAARRAAFKGISRSSPHSSCTLSDHPGAAGQFGISRHPTGHSPIEQSSSGCRICRAPPRSRRERLIVEQPHELPKPLLTHWTGSLGIRAQWARGSFCSQSCICSNP